jgi:ATP/ADP translocase
MKAPNIPFVTNMLHFRSCLLVIILSLYDCSLLSPKNICSTFSSGFIVFYIAPDQIIHKNGLVSDPSYRTLVPKASTLIACEKICLLGVNHSYSNGYLLMKAHFKHLQALIKCV